MLIQKLERNLGTLEGWINQFNIYVCDKYNAFTYDDNEISSDDNVFTHDDNVFTYDDNKISSADKVFSYLFHISPNIFLFQEKKSDNP